MKYPSMHIFIPNGLNRKRAFINAEKISAKGIAVLLHNHSARHVCQFQTPENWRVLCARVPDSIWRDHLLYMDCDVRDEF